MSARKKKPVTQPCTLEEMAAVQFAPLPEAAGLGHDRQRWAKSAEYQRQMAVMAGHIVSKSKEELIETSRKILVDDKGFNAWQQMIKAMEHQAGVHEAAAEIITAARTRSMIAMAAAAEAPGLRGHLGLPDEADEEAPNA